MQSLLPDCLCSWSASHPLLCQQPASGPCHSGPWPGCVLLLVVEAEGQLASWHLLAGQCGLRDEGHQMQQGAPGSYLAIKQGCPSRALRGNPWLQLASSKPHIEAFRGRLLAGQLQATWPCLAVQEVACHPLAQQSAVLAELIAEAKASRDEVENLSPNSQV